MCSLQKKKLTKELLLAFGPVQYLDYVNLMLDHPL